MSPEALERSSVRSVPDPCRPMLDLHHLPPIPDELTTVSERAVQSLTFNVMPGRLVAEELLVREYRVGTRYVEAHFDRTYRSAMMASPSHLTFLSAMIQSQKLIYLLACRELRLPYDPDGDERLKVWPTMTTVAMPKMVTDEQDLVQRGWCLEFKSLGHGRYFFEGVTAVGEGLRIGGQALVLTLGPAQ